MIKHKYLYIAGLSISSLFTNCTGNFEEINTNPIGITNEQINADFTLISAYIQQAQRNIILEHIDDYQLAVSLSSDAYSGYMGAQAPFRGNSNNLTYDLFDGWNNFVFNKKYINVMNPTEKAILIAKSDSKLADIDALARIIRVDAMSRTSAKIGPIIYSNYNKPDNKSNIKYDTEAEVYNHFFADLDIAMNSLKNLQNQPVSTQIKFADLAYTENNYNNWLRVANTLRLRLALRIAYINPTLAKTQAEIALNPSNGGLLENNSQNFSVKLSGNHPLNILGYEWSDTRMGAPMESFLTGLKDPRISAYFDPAIDPLVAGQYKGIRNGINIDGKARYDGYSPLKRINSGKMQLMVAAEAWFLKAEAALRGYTNAGDIQGNYEKGILVSMDMHSFTQTQSQSYINNASNKPSPYKDPKAITAGENDVLEGSPYLSTITVKWDNASTKERKLERIITQKWIAIFPDGEEAWTEYRRTGYPILYPNIVNYSSGLIPSIPGVRRIPIPISEFNTNSDAAKEAEKSLNGPNTGGTRLWWDVENKAL